MSHDESKTNDTQADFNSRDLATRMIQAEYVTLAQLRQQLGLTGHQLAGAIKTGKLKAKQVGYVVRPEDAEEFRSSFLEEVFEGKYRIRTTPKREQE